MTELKFTILGSPDTWHNQATARALGERHIQPVFVDPQTFRVRLGGSRSVSSQENMISDTDLLLVREVPGGSLEQVIFRMDVLHQLEDDGVAVVNSPFAIEKMVDKYYTLFLMQQSGLHVPETLIYEDISEGLKAFQELGGDVVIKPLFGNRGIGMVRVTDEETAGRALRALQLGGSVYYLQKFIPHANRDIRVMVVGDECIAAMERVADQWKTNISAGGKPVKLELSPEIVDASLRASRAVGADYCGVDLLRSESGELFVIEVNSMPAWQGLQQVTDFDIAGRVIDHCLSCKRKG